MMQSKNLVAFANLAASKKLPSKRSAWSKKTLQRLLNEGELDLEAIAFAIPEMYEQTEPKRVLYRRKNERRGTVYIIKSSESNLYKIGHTRDVYQRIANLQTASGLPCSLVHQIVCEDRQQLERRIHQMFSSKRVRGEWFDLSEDDLKVIRETT